jgi:hypothetical protein
MTASPADTRLHRVADLAARMRQVQDRGRTQAPVGEPVPVVAGVAGLLPSGGLRPGAAYTVEGSTSLALTLVAEASAAGAWCGAVGVSDLGAEAAAELGVALNRFVLVPRPGPEWVSVLATLAEVLTVVVVRPPERVYDGEAARLAARLRQHGAVLISLGEWPRSEVRLAVRDGGWLGPTDGRGRLVSRQIEVVTTGRGLGRPGYHRLWLPDPAGLVRPVTATPASTAPASTAPVAAAMSAATISEPELDLAPDVELDAGSAPDDWAVG